MPAKTGSHLATGGKKKYSPSALRTTARRSDNAVRRSTEIKARQSLPVYEEPNTYEEEYKSAGRSVAVPEKTVNRVPEKRTDRQSEARAKCQEPVQSSNKRERIPLVTRMLIILLTLCVFGAIGGFGTVMMITRGPSERAKTLFVRTFNDTATLKNIPYYFMPAEEVDQIKKPTQQESMEVQYPFEKEAVVNEVVIPEEPEYQEAVELIDVTGPTWHGKMILVHDPSLLILGTPNDEAGHGYGTTLTVEGYCEKYGAIAGITAGGFDMVNNVPAGFVINHGQLLYGTPDYTNFGLAITKDHKLVVGEMSVQEILDMDADIGLCWWPILIKDGVKQTGLGGGFSARCAIGQRADGTFILVTIEGRMVSSLGATMDDLADFMEEQGAINAINLDSGRSAVMVYNGENITKVAIGSGVGVDERALPDAFLVLPEE